MLSLERMGDEDERRKAEVERMFSEFAPKFPKAPQMEDSQLKQEINKVGASAEARVCCCGVSFIILLCKVHISICLPSVVCAQGGKLVIVDVRTKDEQDVSMIEGAMRKDDFEARKDEFKGHKVIAYCTIGYRSGKYVETLKVGMRNRL